MHFGENQLSPHSIGISPLPTPHRKGFYPLPVLASSRCYTAFTLGMGRSCGFGSHAGDFAPSSDSVSLRLQRSSALTSPPT